MEDFSIRKRLQDYKAEIIEIKRIGLNLMVRVKNSSCSAWSRQCIRLVVFSDDKDYWRGDLPKEELLPGEEAEIKTQLYKDPDIFLTKVEVQMVHEHFCYFGQRVRVSDYVIRPYDAEIVSVSCPSAMNAHLIVPLSVKVKNTGLNAWKEEDGIRLCVKRDGKDVGARMMIKSGDIVESGKEYGFEMDDFRLPSRGGFVLEFGMVMENIAFFGNRDTAFVTADDRII